MAGIAALAGVSRPAVSNWRRRHDDFPKPVSETGAASLFRVKAVEGWLSTHRKDYAPQSLAQRLWSGLTRLRDVATPESLLELGATFVGLMALADRGKLSSFRDGSSLYQLHPSTLAAALQRASEEARSVADPALFVADFDGLADTADFLFDLHRSMLEHGAEDVFEALMACVERTADRASPMLTNPGALVDLLVQLAHPIEGRIYDPHCGYGDFLVAAARTVSPDDELQLVGSDPRQTAWRTAGLRLLVHGFSAELHHENVMPCEADRGVEANMVLTSLPFTGGTNPGLDPGGERWFAGQPTRSSGDLAWVQHNINRLAPDGRAYQVVRPSAAFQGGPSGRIRHELVARRCVHAIVALPRGVWPQTGIAGTIWITGRPGSGKDEVLFIDADGHKEPHRGKRGLDADRVTPVVDCYKAWRSGRGSQTDEIAHAAVAISKLLGDGCNLNPSRWLGEAADRQGHLREHLASTAEAFESARITLNAATKARAVSWFGVSVAVPKVTVRELIDKRLATLIRSRRIPSDAIGSGEIPLIRAGDLTDEWTVHPGSRVEPAVLGPESRLTEAGDVLIVADGRFRTAVDWNGGSATAAPVHILRLDTRVFRPLISAALLARSFDDASMRGVGVRHADVYGLELPILDPVATEKLTHVLERLVDQRRQAAGFISATDDLIRDLTDAIAAGDVSMTSESETQEQGA